MRYLIPTFILSLLLIFPLTVSAQNSYAERDTKRVEREATKVERTAAMEDRQRERSMKKTDRCEEHGNRFSMRKQKFSEHREKYVNRLGNVSTRLENVITKLNEKDIDTTTLQTQLDTLNKMIEELKAEYATFVDMIETAGEYTCGESDGAYKEALLAAKEQLKIVHAKAKTIREYFQNEIKPTIAELKESFTQEREDNSHE